MTPAERKALIDFVAKALGEALDNEALDNEALESPEEIATVIVYALLTEYDLTRKGGH